jgi:hypothetical protein
MSLVEPAFRPVREHTPPTFLFPIMQLSKNRRTATKGNNPSSPPTKARKPNQQHRQIRKSELSRNLNRTAI